MALGRNIQQDYDIFGNSSDIDDYVDSLAGIQSRKRRKKSSRRARKTHKRRNYKRRVKRSSKIKHTKNGQPYIIDKRTGKARFIKRR